MKKLFTLIALVTAMFSSGFSQTCDTLFNLTSVTDTPVVYIADTGTGAGYLSGNNVYGDFAKAEGFASVTGEVVTSAVLYFGTVTVNPGDSASTVKVYVWDNTGTDINGNSGAPGNAIDSATLTLGEIAAGVTATQNNQTLTGVLVNFTRGAALTDTFYVGVVLPTVTGDTIALYTNTFNGTGGNGWEYEYNYNTGDGSVIWGSYDEDYGSTGLGNYITVTTCALAPSTAFIPGDTTICASSAINFTDKSINAPLSWSWTFGDGGTSTNQNPSHTFAAAGTYTVKEKAVNGNGADSTTHTVTVLALPAGTLQVTEASSSTSGNGAVAATVTGGATPYVYAWSNDSTDASISNLAPGTYVVTITDNNLCSTVDTAHVGVTGILQLSAGAQVSIYPNPVSDVLNMVWSQKMNTQVSVLDLNGQVLGSFETNGDLKSTYNVHNLAAGSYILRITDKTNNQQQSMLFSKF